MAAQMGWGERLRSVGVLALGTAAVVLLPALYFLALVPLETLWRDFVVIPATLLRTVFVLPTPPLLPGMGAPFDLPVWLAFYFPPLVCAAAAALLLVTRRRSLPDQGQRLGDPRADRAGGVALPPGLQPERCQPPDPREYCGDPLGGVVLAALLPLVRLRLTRMVVYAALAIIGLYYVGLPLFFQLRIVGVSANPDCVSPLPRSGCIRLDAGQQQAVAYIQAHTTPDTPLYVGLPRHDQVTVNDAMFYFLADRPPASAYHHLMTGIATTAPVQAQIVDALTRTYTPYVVLWAGDAGLHEANGTSVSSGITLLDDFLAQHYQPVAHFGDYTILQAR